MQNIFVNARGEEWEVKYLGQQDTNTINSRILQHQPTKFLKYFTSNLQQNLDRPPFMVCCIFISVYYSKLILHILKETIIEKYIVC